MSSTLGATGDGQTPLDEDAIGGLLPSYITTQGELNDAEERNIAKATLGRRQPVTAEALDDLYLRNLHRAMFSDVWAWAGKYRTVDTNLGVPWEHISAAVVALVADVRAWLDLDGVDADDASLRFHHRLVTIHPFRNGNGRHARIAANYVILSVGGAPFTWGASGSVDIANVRAAYLSALRRADAGDLRPLLVFARS